MFSDLTVFNLVLLLCFPPPRMRVTAWGGMWSSWRIATIVFYSAYILYREDGRVADAGQWDNCITSRSGSPCSNYFSCWVSSKSFLHSLQGPVSFLTAFPLVSVSQKDLNTKWSQLVLVGNVMYLCLWLGVIKPCIFLWSLWEPNDIALVCVRAFNS